jgi:hypothetical protein
MTKSDSNLVTEWFWHWFLMLFRCLSSWQISWCQTCQDKSCVFFVVWDSLLLDHNLMLLSLSSKFSLSKLAPLEAVLFDVDGTLCDSDPLHYYAFREMLQEVMLLCGKLRSWLCCDLNVSFTHLCITPWKSVRGHVLSLRRWEYLKSCCLIDRDIWPFTWAILLKINPD